VQDELTGRAVEVRQKIAERVVAEMDVAVDEQGAERVLLLTAI
jgi:hypothetical protein